MSKLVKRSGMTEDEKEDYKYDRESYERFKRATMSGLGVSYSILWALCHIGLQHRMSVHPDFAHMRDGDCGELYRILSVITNGTTSATTEDVMSTLVDSVYNWMYIKGDDYADLSEYMVAFENKYDAAKRAGFGIASPDLRDLYITELTNRGEATGALCVALEEWKMAANDEDGRRAEATGIKAVVDAYKARVYVKRAVGRYHNYRIELQNNYMSGSVTFPATVVEASRRMDYWRPLVVPHAAIETGSSHLQQGVGGNRGGTMTCMFQM